MAVSKSLVAALAILGSVQACVVHEHVVEPQQQRPAPRPHKAPPPPPPPVAKPAPPPVAKPVPPPAAPEAQQPPFEEPPPRKTKPAEVPYGGANGKPRNLRAGAPAAYWIWRTDDGMWHLRTTTTEKRIVFSGRVRASVGQITEVSATRREFNDRIRVLPDGVAFHFVTDGDIDGFDFRASSRGCVEFDLPRAPRVLVGENEFKAPGDHFSICPKERP